MTIREAKLEVWRDPKIGVVAQSRLIRERAALLCVIAYELKQRTELTVARSETIRRRTEAKSSRGSVR